MNSRGWIRAMDGARDVHRSASETPALQLDGLPAVAFFGDGLLALGFSALIFG